VTYSEILELPPAERLQLLEAIWDSLTSVPEAIPVSQEIRDELDRRLESYYENPDSARPWKEIKEKLFGGSE
jgi:putative addiction module component (TIGR02574 family)